MSLRRGTFITGRLRQTKVSIPQIPRHYTAGMCHRLGASFLKMTASRFVHLQNPYEFAEEYDKPLCMYASSLKRTGSDEVTRGQLDLLYVFQLLRVHQL